MFGRRPQRSLREFLDRFERPRVALAGVGDSPTYDGVVMEVLSDAIILVRARVATPNGGTLQWVPIDGSVVVERSKIQHVQLLNGLPG